MFNTNNIFFMQIRGTGLIIVTEFTDNKSPTDFFPPEWGKLLVVPEMINEFLLWKYGFFLQISYQYFLKEVMYGALESQE